MNDGLLSERLERLENELEQVTHCLHKSIAWQERLSDFVDEMSPLARAMMDSGITEFDRLDRLGYFRFGRDLMDALDRVVENYEPDSLPALAETFSDVVSVLQLLSQPKILAAAQDIASEFDAAGSEPIEVLGAARRVETEKDIQRGLAFALDLFGTLGRSVSRAPRLKRRHDRARTPARPGTESRRHEPTAASSASKLQSVECSFIEDTDWSKDWATKEAEILGVGPLDDLKWKIVEFSRSEFKELKKAPNIRRITKALDISTKELYRLFPNAPGPTISRIAGVPKPAGCL